jgi:hypothetical protein
VGKALRSLHIMLLEPLQQIAYLRFEQDPVMNVSEVIIVSEVIMHPR